MKKLFFLFVSFLATTCLWAYDFQLGDLYYKITSESNPYTVEVSAASNDITIATIPENVTYNGTTYSVTIIGWAAFEGCSSLISVTIPNSVTIIRWYAFSGCSSLTSITIPNSVTSIGNKVFYGCSSLTSVTIPNSVTSIGGSAFEGCSSLTSITIPNSVTSIGENAFEECSSLTSVTIPNISSIIETFIESWEDYRLLTLVTLTAPSIEEFCQGDGNYFLCQKVNCEIKIQINDKEVKEITIPNSVTSIREKAFSRCSSLISIIIPNSVTSIGFAAFSDCSSLTSVTIGNGVTSISGAAFSGCSSLTSITIPESVISIGDRAFEDCNSLTNVTLNSNAIVGKSHTKKSNISHIFDSQVTNYIIGDSVTSIGEYAFSDCSSLTSVTIGNGVTSIGEHAFAYCSSLTKTNYTGDIADWCNIKFGDFYANPIYYSHNFYINDQEVKDLVIPNTVDSIQNEAFAYCSSLTSITIPNSVTSIGNKTFDYCNNLTNVTLHSNAIVSKSYTAVSNISNIFGKQVTNYIIGDDVTSIGEYAFAYCSSLTSVTIPNSVTSIGYGAFYGCSSLPSVTIPNSVTSIGEYAFFKCSSLTSVTIPNSVTSIGEHAFAYCSSLTSVTIPNSVTSIGHAAFCDCSSFTYVTCEAETPPTAAADAFDGVSKSIPIYVPCGCVEAYKAASGWAYFTNIQGPLAEYSIEVDVNDNIMGTAKVDINSSCDTRISATANYGYYFVQWSDGVSDNPRTLILTQDTTFTAEFAPNTYTISSQSSDTERGTTSGDITTTYLDYVTISATANYGYHFAHWDDYNHDNPRQVQVTKNKTYTAYFDKNTYYITKHYDSNQGYVDGYSSGEYLDNITLTAEPNYRYYFVRWADGVTDNPRHFILTQDTVFSAEFAPTFSGQCGDNLYWNYDKTNQTISITGSGDMYDYTAETQPWLLFKEEIIKVTTTNTVTSIGTSAFEGCVRLGKVSLGIGMENIAASAFAECNRLYDVYCYATYPPFAAESSFANYNVYLYVPRESQRDYTLDVIWGKFKFIECVDSEEVTTDDVVVTPRTNDVTITWPTEGNAATYTIVIKKGNEVFCTLTFNAEGQLLNIAFAPCRDGNRPAQYAEQAGKGYRFTVTNLESGTKYGYNIEVKDASNKTIKSHSGEFTTQSTTAVDNITTNNANIQKIIRDGQFIIVRDGVEYNAVGQEM